MRDLTLLRIYKSWIEICLVMNEMTQNVPIRIVCNAV